MSDTCSSGSAMAGVVTNYPSSGPNVRYPIDHRLQINRKSRPDDLKRETRVPDDRSSLLPLFLFGRHVTHTAAA